MSTSSSWEGVFDSRPASPVPPCLDLDFDGRLPLGPCMPPEFEATEKEKEVEMLQIQSLSPSATGSELPTINAADAQPPNLKEIWNQLNSFVPLLELLPAFKKADGVYVLSGRITDADIELLFEHSRYVEEFTEPLTPSQTQISESSYIRLAHRLRGPLLPALRSLRFCTVTPCHTYLPLFIASTLTHVEIRDICPDAKHLVTSFLDTLPWEAPSLMHLVLCGPLKLSREALQPIAELKELRYLQMDKIADFSDFGDLACLGTLPKLRNLSLDLRDSHYESSGLPEMKGFHELTSLHFTAPFPFIRDLLEHVGSNKMQEIDIVPVVHSRHDPKATMDSMCHLNEGGYPVQVPHQEAELKKAKLQDGDTVVVPTKKPSKRAKEQVLRVRCDTPPPPAPKPIDWLLPFKQCFDKITSSWRATVTSIGIDLHDVDTSRRVFELPRTILQFLQQLHGLESLRITGWKIRSLNSVIEPLVASLPYLEVLNLPLGRHGSALHLGTLRVVAGSCPHLNTLRACLDLSTIPSFQDSASPKYALQHGLKTLVLDNLASPGLDTVALLAVARQLNILFPFVTIEEYQLGPEKLWGWVSDILKMYQAVREDDRNRMM